MRFAQNRFTRRRKGGSSGHGHVVAGGGDGGNGGIAGAAGDAGVGAGARAATAAANEGRPIDGGMPIPPPTGEAKNPRLSTVIEDTQFESVLDRPFSQWNEIEGVIANYVPKWTHRQRGCIILHLVRFLELKVVMEEYVGSHLLAPSPLVEIAWRALILESLLYKRVTCYIQDFHCRSRRMIHHSLVNRNEHPNALEERFNRAQSLFQCCYGEKMPVSLEEIDSSDTSSMDDASALTDAMSTFRIAGACTSLTTTDDPTSANESSKIVHVINRTPEIILHHQREHIKYQIQSAFSCLNIIQHTMFGQPGVPMEEEADFTSIVTPEERSADTEGVEVIDIPNEF